MKAQDGLKKVWLVVLIVIALVWLSIPVSAAVPGWSDPKTITDINARTFRGGAQLAYDEPGKWLVVWTNHTDPGSPEIRYSCVTYFDSTGIIKTLAVAEEHRMGSQFDPYYYGTRILYSDVARDNEGNLGVIYLKDSDIDGTSYLYIISRINGIWSEPLSIPAAADAFGDLHFLKGDPKLAFSAPGKWYIAGVVETGDQRATDYKLISLNSTGYHETIASSQRTSYLEDDENVYVGNTLMLPSIASDSDGNLGVIFFNFSWNKPKTLDRLSSVEYISCVNGVWSKPLTIVDSLHPYLFYSWDADIAFTAPEKWHVVLSRSLDGMLYVNSLGNTGTLSNEGEDVRGVSIASDSKGYLGAIYWPINTHTLKYMSNNGAGADLTIVSMKPLPENAFVEDPINTTFTVKNIGTEDAGSFYVNVTLSDDAIADPTDPTDKVLSSTHFESLPKASYLDDPASVKSVNIKIKLPSDKLSKDYYIIATAVVDENEPVKDINPVNNAKTQLLPVGHKYAVVSGISKYPIQKKYPGAENAKEMMLTLKNMRLNSENTKLLRNDEVTIPSINSAITGFNLKPQDLFIFFYSGHAGDKEEPNAGENYGMLVLTPDKKPKEVFYNYTSLFAALPKNTYKTMVILDACYSGDAIKNIPKPSQKFIVITSTNGKEKTGDYDYKWMGKYSFVKYFSEGISIVYTRDERLHQWVQSVYPADKTIPRDGIITSWEAFDYARDKIQIIGQHPLIDPPEKSNEISIFTYDPLDRY